MPMSMLFQASGSDVDLSPKDKKFLDSHVDAMLAFWQLRDEVPGTLPVVFTYIARNPGISPSDLAEKTGFAQTNISKLLKILIQELELVTMEHDDKDWRIRRFFLTPKGDKFLKTILPT